MPDAAKVSRWIFTAVAIALDICCIPFNKILALCLKDLMRMFKSLR